MKTRYSISSGFILPAKGAGWLMGWAGIILLVGWGQGTCLWAKTTPSLLATADSGQADIGAVEKPGTAVYEEATGIYTISGAGKAGGFFDACQFVYQPLEGDGQIVARVLISPDTNRIAYAGIMMRENLVANSKNAFLLVTPTNSVAFWRRNNTPGLTTSGADIPGLSVPIWLKLVRKGQ